MFGGLPRSFIKSYGRIEWISQFYDYWIKHFWLFKDAFFSVKLETGTPYNKFLHVEPNWCHCSIIALFSSFTDRRWTSKLKWWISTAKGSKVMVKLWEVLDVDIFLFNFRIVFFGRDIMHTIHNDLPLQESKIASWNYIFFHLFPIGYSYIL